VTSSRIIVTAVITVGFLLGFGAGVLTTTPLKSQVQAAKEAQKFKMPPELEHRKPHPINPLNLASKVHVHDVFGGGGGGGGGTSQPSSGTSSAPASQGNAMPPGGGGG